MHHLLGFFESQNAVTNDAIGAIADQVFTRNSGAFQIPTPLSIYAAFVSQVNLTRARIATSTLRRQGYPNIHPVSLALLPPTDPNLMDMREFPLDLEPREEVSIESVTHTAAANSYAALWVGRRGLNMNINRRDLRWVRFTASVTTTAGSWSTPGTITLVDQVEGGVYGVYGMYAWFATGVLARLIFPDEQKWRPGCLMHATEDLRSHNIFRGGLGKWGAFDTYALPQIETVDNASAAITVNGSILTAKEG